jgi:hypothetical protein
MTSLKPPEEVGRLKKKSPENLHPVDWDSYPPNFYALRDRDSCECQIFPGALDIPSVIEEYGKYLETLTPIPRMGL